ncbi:hypothetical protein H1R20_g11541, partial [Candolleomyces eurysporus]
MASAPVIDLVSDSKAETRPESSKAATGVPQPRSYPGHTPPSFFVQQTKQAMLFQFGAKKVSAEEAHQQTKRVTEMLGTDYGAWLIREARRKKARREREKETNRLRQQRFCTKHQAEKAMETPASLTMTREVVLTDSSGSVAISSSIVDNLAALSQPGENWKQGQNGKKKRVVQEKHQRINWFNPFLWAIIDRIAPCVAFSPQLLVLHLNLKWPMFFKRLHKGTVSKWMVKLPVRGWSEKTLWKVEAGASLKRSGCVGVLTLYPAIVEEVKGQLQGLRDAGVTVDRLLARSIILAVVTTCESHLLAQFKCTEQYVGHFLESVMGWSVRQGTHAAAKLPDDAVEQCKRTLFRLVHLINLYNIPPGLIINMDQTRVIILMSKKCTFKTKGARQVSIAHQDEKRAYTLCVASTPTGNILPFQQVWAGKTAGSLPTVANSNKTTSHFSTLKTMKEWMKEILQPWVEEYIRSHDLPGNQKLILFIDCYPVHISEEFRTYVFKEFPNVFLIFVPANCTGIMQPADVGLNRVIKHSIRQAALDYLVKSHKEQLDKGLTTTQIKFTTSLPALRNASVDPSVKLFENLQGANGRDLIRRTLEKCMVKEFNLIEECLTSRKTKVAYWEYLEKDPTLRSEIKAKIGREALRNATLQAEDQDMDPYGIPDATDIPISRVVADLDHDSPQPGHVEFQSGLGDQYCVTAKHIDRELDGTLVPTSEQESIWAYTMDGKTVSNVLS